MKKAVKRLFSAVLCIVMLLSIFTNSALAASATSGKCGKNAKWSYNGKTKTLTISGKGPMYNHYNPWEKYWDSTKKVKIKKGITHIGVGAFDGIMWVRGSSISIPDTVKSIGEGALCCTGVKHITIPGSVKTIKEGTFSLSEAKTIQLKKGVQVIEGYAFDRTNLTSITFPSTVKKIGEHIFAYSYGIKTVVFTGDAPKINKMAFSYHDYDGEDEKKPIRLTIYYPKHNKTWKSVIKKQYGGKIKWVAK